MRLFDSSNKKLKFGTNLAKKCQHITHLKSKLWSSCTNGLLRTYNQFNTFNLKCTKHQFVHLLTTTFKD